MTVARNYVREDEMLIITTNMVQKLAATGAVAVAITAQQYGGMHDLQAL